MAENVNLNIKKKKQQTNEFYSIMSEQGCGGAGTTYKAEYRAVESDTV